MAISDSNILFPIGCVANGQSTLGRRREMKVKHLVGVLVILSCLVGTAWAKGSNGNGGGGTATLTAEEAGNLTFLFEEEKLARDVYQYFSDTYGAVIFSNIAASEQTHMDAVEGLLLKYNQEVPTTGVGLCVYYNADLATDCWILINQGEILVYRCITIGCRY